MALEAVAQRALDYPYRIWGFGEGMALLGLLRAGELLSRPEWIDFVAELVKPSLAGPPVPAYHLIPVEVLFELQRLRPQLDIAPAVRRFVRAIDAEVHRPDLPGLQTMVWVDCLHTDAPGLRLAGDRGGVERVVKRGCEHLQDSSGLFSHGYDTKTQRTNGIHWGRGQGWALHGLRAAGSRQTEALINALSKWEQDGRWRTIVDNPEAPVEHSVSALVAAGAPDSPMRQRAMQAALDALEPDGGLPVSEATPVGSYLDRQTGVYPWGQGPLLLALLAEATA